VEQQKQSGRRESLTKIRKEYWKEGKIEESSKKLGNNGEYRKDGRRKKDWWMN
jgi:hypothetical protein